MPRIEHHIHAGALAAFLENPSHGALSLVGRRGGRSAILRVDVYDLIIVIETEHGDLKYPLDQPVIISETLPATEDPSHPSLRDRLIGVISNPEAGDAAQLADALVAELVSSSTLLVSFEVITDHENGDWESGIQGWDWSTLGNPTIVGHDIGEGEMARLYFEIEGAGTLNEGDGYAQLDKLIESLAEPTATAVREREAERRRGGFDLLSRI